MVEGIQEKLRLHGAIIRIGDVLKITQEDLGVLQAAKNARNFIAHEASIMGCISDVDAGSILRMYAELQSNVRALASGDNLVSAWCYEICEKEQAPVRIREEYVELVLAWVFRGAPINLDGDWEWLSITPACRDRGA